MSLWKIPDNETTEFMELFYTNWLADKEINDAFRQTQLTMMKVYKDDPSKWAGFVLIN